MGAKGSSSCTPCGPCSNWTDGCGGTICVPKVVCVTVTVDPTIQLCCPSSSFSFTLFYSAEVGVCGGWSGTGSCGFVNVGVGMHLVANSAGVATIEGTLSFSYLGDVPPGTNTDFTVDVTSGFSISLSHTDSAGSYGITIGAASTIDHPWNNQSCNPCICARCVPESFCLSFYKLYGTGSDYYGCNDCNAILVMAFDVVSCTWSASFSCADGTYSATISFPNIYDGGCYLKFVFSGPDISVDTTLSLEALGVRSTNGCYICCGTNPADPNQIARQGKYGPPSCSISFNCTDDPPEENPSNPSPHSGRVFLTQPEFESTFTIRGGREAGGDDAGVSVTPLWCGERCVPVANVFASCCERLVPPANLALAELCNDLDRLYLSFIAPQCSGGLDGYAEYLLRGNLSAGCVTVDNLLFSSNNDNPGLAANNATQIIWQSSTFCLYCLNPDDCAGTWIGENPEYLQLYYNFSWGRAEDPCSTSASGYASPTIVSCNPIFMEFEIAVPYAVGDGELDPLTEDCPSLCLEGGTLIIRITE